MIRHIEFSNNVWDSWVTNLGITPDTPFIDVWKALGDEISILVIQYNAQAHTGFLDSLPEANGGADHEPGCILAVKNGGRGFAFCCQYNTAPADNNLYWTSIRENVIRDWKKVASTLET